MLKYIVMFYLFGHFIVLQVQAVTIEDFENTTNWIGITQEGSLVYVGTGSGHWDNHPVNKVASKTFTPMLDVSDSEYISVMLYSEVSNDAGINLCIFSENSATAGGDYYKFWIKLDWTGWRHLKIMREKFITVRSPLGWNQLTKVEFSCYWGGNTPLSDSSLFIDDFHAGKKWINGVATNHRWDGSNYIFCYQVDIESPKHEVATVVAKPLFNDNTPMVINNSSMILDNDGTGILEFEIILTAAELAQLEALETYTGQIILTNSNHVLDNVSIVATIPLPARQSPMLFISEDEIDNKISLSNNHPWMAGAIDDIIQKANQWPGKYLADYNLFDVSLPPEGGQWPSLYVCPYHCVQLEYEPYLNTHSCPVDNNTFIGTPFDQVIFSRRHDDLAQYAKTLALAYQFTGTIGYAQSAKQILMEYVQIYDTYPIHYKDYTYSNLGARVMYDTLHEAMWLINIAWSYDLIANSGVLSTSEDYEITKFLHDAADVIACYDAGISNWQAWHNTAIGLVGFVTEDWTLVSKAIMGSSGLLFQIDESVVDDGMWYEGSWVYHMESLRAISQLAEAARRAGYNIWNHPKLKKMYTLPLGMIMPNGILPAFNDSIYYSINSSLYELAYARFNLVELANAISPDKRGLEALIFGAPVLPTGIWKWANQSEMLMNVDIMVSGTEAHGGQRYARMSYDTTNANMSAYGAYGVSMYAGMPNEVPDNVTIWLNGDNSGQGIIIRIYDATGERYAVDIGSVNWSGWKLFSLGNPSNWIHFSGDNNGIINLPIQYLAVVLYNDVHAQGSIGLDDISFHYPSMGTINVVNFENSLKSHVYSDSGYAVLNIKDQNNTQSYLAIDFGEHGGWHGHYDKLGFISFANHSLMGIDPGKHSYALDTHSSWEKTTIAHNTVVVDETNQLEATGSVIDQYLGELVAMVRTDAGGSYSQANLQRTMVQAGDYILDCFEVESLDANAHQYDWAYHNDGAFTTNLSTMTSVQLPSDQGFQHLDNAVSVVTNNDFYTQFSSGPLGSNASGYTSWSNEPTMIKSYTAIEDPVLAHSGNWYGKITYDFTNTTLNAYGLFFLNTPGTLPCEVPENVQLWINGNNSGHIIKVRLNDVNDERYIISLGSIDWTGWQLFTVNTPANWPHTLGDNNGIIDLPIKNLTIEIDAESLNAGSIGVDDISFEYSGSQVINFADYEQKRTAIRLHTLGVTGTEVVKADAMGPDLNVSTPMVLLRRNKTSTVFETLLESFGQNSTISSFTKLPCNANSKAYQINSSSYHDVVFWTKDTVLTLQNFGNYQTNGAFVRYRTDTNGAPESVSMADATTLVYNGVSVISLNHPLESFEVKWVNEGNCLVLYLSGNTASVLQIPENNIEHIRIDGMSNELTYSVNNGIITVDLPAIP